MITIEQRIRLLDAGYTPEQISEWEKPMEQPKQEERPKQKEQPKQEEQPKQKEQPKQEEQTKQETLDINKVLESNKMIMENIAKLTSAIQANAIASAVQPGGAAASYNGEQAIAEIINPPIKKGD